jgi:hypothetical protein
MLAGRVAEEEIEVKKGTREESTMKEKRMAKREAWVSYLCNHVC